MKWGPHKKRPGRLVKYNSVENEALKLFFLIQFSK